MRPTSIVNFERIVILQIVLGLISSYLVWDQMSAQVGQTGVSPGTVMGVQAVMIVLYLLLVWFISRHGSPVAKWIYVVLAGLGLIAGVTGIGQTFALGTIAGVLSLLQIVLTAASIWLLFRPDAKAWFAEGRGGDTHTHG